MSSTPTSKEVSTKSTTSARVAASNGPTATAAEIRKKKKKRPGTTIHPSKKTPTKQPTGNNAQSETNNENLPTNPQPDQPSQEAINMVPAMGTTTKPARNANSGGITLQPVPLPSFFEESIDILQASPSPNCSINQTHADLLSALQNEVISSTPGPHISEISLHPAMLEANQSFTAEPKSMMDMLIEAEEQGDPPGNNGPNGRSPLSRYTSGPFPPIHYTHPMAIFNHLEVNTVGDWENLPNGKILMQPLDPNMTTIDKYPHLKSLLFAAIVKITSSHDVSVCAPKAKANTYRPPFSFLIYNITEAQAHTLLEHRIWSSPTITFSTSTFNPSCPNYLFTIKGLTTMDEKTVLNMVNKVWHNQSSFAFFQQICENLPKLLKEQAARTIQHFIGSLEVSRLDIRLRGNTLAPVFNIYTNGSLISNYSIWSKIRAFLATCTYAIQAQDPGILIIAPFRCSICHAADHPRGLCPLPLTEGWNGPRRHDPPGAQGNIGGF